MVLLNLLYADHLIAKWECELQSLLFPLETWCKHWQINVTSNLPKKSIVHTRKIRASVTKHKFEFNGKEVRIDNNS